MMFRNEDAFNKRVVKSGLVWSRTLPTLISTNEANISVPLHAKWTDISNIFTVGSWKMDKWMSCQQN